MDAMKTGWFSEINDFWPGVSLSLEVEKTLHQGRSQYQDVLVLQTKSYGKALILDGIIQCTEKDEFAYQEMIAFIPLCSHPNPKNVLIVGGGDGGVAREVAKHPGVERIVQIEIDSMVIDVSKKYLPFMGVGFDNPKLTLNVGDGFEFMKQHSNEFDVIITDSSDPIGPAECLFQESYFNLMKTALRPGGIVCSQAGTAWMNLDHVVQTLKHCKSAFPVVDYCIASVPSYPTGQIGFVLGGLGTEMNFKVPTRIFEEEQLDEMNLRYYNSEIHKSAFVLPRFVEKSLKPYRTT
ncbi:PREDICTED: spermidine synthase [Polistes dominula]|uniref:Spermidine synthase n=1 Tax=Polistes dominula TaxID=743375 RepID=A0ABM1J3A1_POLDO|nr:PREDICTED: spermidine synthase [Polistes dominula]XP_015186935.1 PREDICTED: spermidine synthase [Polistes dominula]XP_015186936.1 PREDICTED: spermidine synthase [Polistes dominula]XP_015186938.1 PREDICTED: spermidine synthase [Polistes dominula]